MRGRWYVVLAAVVAIVVASPALRPSARDGFPLSNYPMFASAVGRRAVVDTATGLTADGTPITLSPALITGTNEVILAVSTVSNAVAAGAERAADLCTEIAGRVATGRADVVQVRIATETYDAVDYFDGHTAPAASETRATCPVSGR